jgi:hypothetical protein
MHTRRLMHGFLALVFFAAPAAHAYVGPGAGAGTIAVVLGILASIVLAFFAILWYPVKRLLKKIRRDKTALAERRDDAPGSGGAT